MTCIEAQALITPFINDKLSVVQLEKFLEHVQNCPDCMEELEVYFALLTAMRQLDEDEEVSSNFKLALKNKINESEEKILRAKMNHIRKRVVFFAVVCLIGVVSSWSVGVMDQVFTMSEEDKFNYFCLQHQQIDQYINLPLGQSIISYPDLMKKIAKEEEEKRLQQEKIAKQKREEQARKKEATKEEAQKKKEQSDKVKKMNNR